MKQTKSSQVQAFRVFDELKVKHNLYAWLELEPSLNFLLSLLNQTQILATRQSLVLLQFYVTTCRQLKPLVLGRQLKFRPNYI